MKLLSCAAFAALFVVACSASDNNPTLDAKQNPADVSPNDPSNPKPHDPNKPNDPTKPTTPIVDPATQSDCDTLAAAFCQRMGTCNHLATSLFGSVAACSTRYAQLCVAGGAAPGTGLTHAALATCTPKIASASCDDLFSNDDTPAPCTFKGTLPDASQCVFDHQCASGDCEGNDAACGACKHVAAIGEACTASTTCAKNAYCDLGSAKCKARAALGSACVNATHHCPTKASCTNGICTASAKVGELCDPNGTTAPNCDLTSGLACVGAPAVCKQFPIATTVGAACGFDAAGLTLCGPGLACAYAGSSGAGTCVTAIPEGGACTPGPNGGSSTCALALECISGKCAVMSAAVCK